MNFYLVFLIIIFILILIIVIVIQSFKLKSVYSDLDKISKNLDLYIKDNDKRKIVSFTNDKKICELLSKVNIFVDLNSTIKQEYNKKNESIRKMISNMSHDLKTPLTVILGYIETINLCSKENLNEKKIQLVKVYSKAEEMLSLINNFFDLAKLESNDISIELYDLNVSEIVREKILDYFEIINEKKINIKIDIPKKPIYANLNDIALKRILDNLISNSLKYGMDGNFIGCKLWFDEDFVYIDIWDNGKGIDESNLDNIFERLYTLEDSRNKKYNSSGLGLTITKRLVEKMNGIISLDSVPREKTLFRIKFLRKK
jgi:signal transduction histidine kinase